MLEDPDLVLRDIAKALSLNQRELAEVIGSSRSTVQRIHKGRTWVTRNQFARLSRAVYPTDQALAARAADLAGTTLEALGLRAYPQPPPSPAVVTPAPVPARPLSPHVSDSILCAAAEAMNLPPQAVRSALRAAFVRARDLGLGLTVETLAAAFERVEGA